MMQRVRPGQIWRPSATEINRTREAADIVERFARTSSRSRRPGYGIAEGVVYLYNKPTTGSGGTTTTIPKWTGVPLHQTFRFSDDQAAETVPDADVARLVNAEQALFEESYRALSLTSDQSVRQYVLNPPQTRSNAGRLVWGVALEPIPPGKVGRVAVSGMVWCRCDRLGYEALAGGHNTIDYVPGRGRFGRDGRLNLSSDGDVMVVQALAPDVGFDSDVDSYNSPIDGWKVLCLLSGAPSHEFEARVGFPEQIDGKWAWRYKIGEVIGYDASAGVAMSSFQLPDHSDADLAWSEPALYAAAQFAINRNEMLNADNSVYGMGVDVATGEFDLFAGVYVAPVPDYLPVRMSILPSYVAAEADYPNGYGSGSEDSHGDWKGWIGVFSAPTGMASSPWTTGSGSSGGTSGFTGTSGGTAGTAGSGSSIASSGGSSAVSSSASAASSGGSSGSGSAGSGSSGGGSGGSGGGGSGGGGSGDSGSNIVTVDSSGSNCFEYGTMVAMADGTQTPIENIKPGDRIASLRVPGLVLDQPWRSQYEWLSQAGTVGLEAVEAVVGGVRLGRHDAVVEINGRIRATFEHPMLVVREGVAGFVSAELVEPGDELVRGDFDREMVRTVEAIDGTVQTVSLSVPGTNVYVADGVFTHNDITIISSGSPSSSSGSIPKSSGSSFASGSSGSGGSLGGGSG